MGNRSVLRPRHSRTVAARQRNPDAISLRRRALAEVDRGADIERSFTRAGIEVRPGIQVDESDRRAGLDTHTAVETGEPPSVLVLEEAVRRVPHDDHGKLVPPHAGRFGHVVLAPETGVGAVSDEHAVEVDGMHTVSATHVQQQPLALPVGRDVEARAVHTCGVARREPRRRLGERHLDVRVVRNVVGHLDRPATGHVDRLPLPGRPLSSHGIGRHLVGRGEQPEGPGAVQRQPAVPLGGGTRAHRESEQGCHRRVRPRAESTDDGEHVDSLRHGTSRGEEAAGPGHRPLIVIPAVGR